MYWHIHHEVLLEFATEPIENRIEYIKSYKPKDEVETRLRLLKPVRGAFPQEVIDARKVWDDAWKVRDDAWKVWDDAWKVRDDAWKVRDDAGKVREDARTVWEDAWKVWGDARKVWDDAWKVREDALVDNAEAINELHSQECPNCPWDGNTIFPEATP